MRARSSIIAAVVLAAAIANAGCGGDDNSTTEAVTDDAPSDQRAGEPGQAGTDAPDSSVRTSSLGKAQFVKQANAICAREKRSLIEKTGAYLAQRESDGEPQAVLVAKAAKEVLAPVVGEQVAALRKLGAPAGDEEEIEEMLVAQEEGAEQISEVETLEPRKDPPESFAEAAEMFQAYGLTECSFSL